MCTWERDGTMVLSTGKTIKTIDDLLYLTRDERDEAYAQPLPATEGLRIHKTQDEILAGVRELTLKFLEMKADLEDHYKESITETNIDEKITAHAQEFIGEVLSGDTESIWEATWHASNDRWFKKRFYSTKNIIVAVAATLASIITIVSFIKWIT